jgi:hypothetical protein
MKRYRPRLPLLLVVGLLLVDFVVPAGANAQTFTAPESARLAAREVLIDVTGGGQPSVARIQAAIEIAAPPARVWAAMLDCTRAMKFVKGLVSCRVLSSDPAGTFDEREHIVSWGLLMPQVRSVFRSDYVRERTISFRRTAGDIDVLEGSWQLDPVRDGTATRLRYTARVGRQTIVPDMLIRTAIESDVPRTLRSLRDEVEHGPR